jgi:hypothetical protein
VNRYLCRRHPGKPDAKPHGFSSGLRRKGTKNSPPLKKWILLIALLAAALSQAQAQGGRGFWHQEWTVEKGDSIPLVHVLPVYVFSRPVDLRRYRRLVDAVKKVYPIAQIAKAKMAETIENEIKKVTGGK